MFSSNVYNKYRKQYCLKSQNVNQTHNWVFKRSGNIVHWICTQCLESKSERD